MQILKYRYTLLKGVKSMKDEKEKIKKEDATKCGEFIPSFFAWKTLKEQKEISDRLANITDEEKE